MLEQVKEMVFELLKDDKSGHGNDHIIRVYNLATKFAENENVNKEIVGLAALLHDVDDYKLVGKENSEKQINAKRIMNKFKIDDKVKKEVLSIIKTMGYSKLLVGIRPISFEGRIVSDADMCDAIGASGIIRSIVYAVSEKGNGIVFDKNTYPIVDITLEQYNSNNKGTTHDTDSAINHFFEKLLKLSNLMMTESGKKEAIERQKIMIEFLHNFFKEENVPEWNQFLDNYLLKENLKK